MHLMQSFLHCYCLPVQKRQCSKNKLRLLQATTTPCWQHYTSTCSLARALTDRLILAAHFGARKKSHYYSRGRP
jgi:hypothetical protein